MIQWFEVYRIITNRLSIFYSNNQSKSGSEMYDRCFFDKEFSDVNPWIAKFYNAYEIRSIDPINIFASLNQSKISDETRIRRVNALLKILSAEERFTEIDFSGCPAPFAIRIMSARKEESQQEIWKIFQQILIKHQDGLNQNVFDMMENWYGVDISSFTIFLFWIDSSNFMPLDKNSNRLLLESGTYKRKPSNYKEYKALLTEKNSDFYRNVAKVSFESENLAEEQQLIKSKVINILEDRTQEESPVIDFKIIAIKPLDGIDKKYLKILKCNQVYTFYNSFDFAEDNRIKYDKTKDIKLYNLSNGENRLDINISAIVGKNGSGKSSVTELLYLAINNVAEKVLGSECNLKKVEGVNLELYFYTQTLYKIRFENGHMTYYRFINYKTHFSDPIPFPIEKDYLTNFFYSIVVNYSHYALNSKELGGWLERIFFKNDAYSVPLVINPMREDGNIDINKENDFVKSRLLTNILEPEVELRQLTENGRCANKLKFKLNKEKATYNYNQHLIILKEGEHQKEIISHVYKYFNIHIANQNEITKCANSYIYKKLFTITENYKHYKKYSIKRNGNLDVSLLLKYFKHVEEDDSHITFKLKQAISFLKFSHLKYHIIDEPIEIQILSDNIQKEIRDNYPLIKLKTIDLIPPSFFDIEIILNDESNFEQLSSGEKQRIHAVNSLVYHLLNINSISDKKNLIKYSFVNVLFDEVELYFHPEMQRTFIDYLLNYLKKLTLNEIYGLNFCFVTHSPFILSDIPDVNILFLDNNGLPVSSKEQVKTFGGNVHELLAHSFFLGSGFIGEFAKKRIQAIIDFLKSAENKSNIFANKENVLQEIQIIGEPFLRDKLMEMYYSKYEREKRIVKLREEISRLENND